MKERVRGFILFHCAYHFIEGVLWALTFTLAPSHPRWLPFALLGMIVGQFWFEKEKRSGLSAHQKNLWGPACMALPVFIALLYRFRWLTFLLPSQRLSAWRWNGAGGPSAVGKNGGRRRANTVKMGY